MGDVAKDVELDLLFLSGDEKIQIASFLNEYVLRGLKKRIQMKYPNLTKNEIISMLRQEFPKEKRITIEDFMWGEAEEKINRIYKSISK